MKTTILNKEVNEEIDWSKPQWVIDETDELVLFTNGKHSEDDFEGTCLPYKGRYEIGVFSKTWSKVYFKPIPKEGLTIHIQND